MTSDTGPATANTPYTPSYGGSFAQTPDKPRSRFRSMGVMFVIALLLGAGAAVFALSRFGVLTQDAQALLGEEPEVSAAAPATAAAAPARLAELPPMGGDSAAMLRIIDLEDRLSRITVQADMASGNAARAEGLLIAFATRRALDSGRGLGYLDEQLQLRFGAAEPEAVATIREFANAPITREALLSELDAIAGTLTTNSDEGFWSNLQSEFSELFVVRRAGTPSTSSEQRLGRARRFIESGNIEAAIAEVEKMPGAGKAEGWLDRARRYAKVQEQLDILETAAIFEPKMLRDTRGSTVPTPSPVPARAPIAVPLP